MSTRTLNNLKFSLLLLAFFSVFALKAYYDTEHPKPTLTREEYRAQLNTLKQQTALMFCPYHIFTSPITEYKKGYDCYTEEYIRAMRNNEPRPIGNEYIWGIGRVITRSSLAPHHIHLLAVDKKTTNQ